jgi:hypothetical protein
MNKILQLFGWLIVFFLVQEGAQAVTVSIFVPATFQPTDDPSTLVGSSVKVDSSQIFTFSRMYMQPDQGESVGLLPYYYRVKAVWQNSDGTPVLENGKPIVSDVYAAVLFDNNLNTWRDVSGISSSIDGKTRVWTAQSAYFVCTQPIGGVRFLQAFRSGSVATSVLYDQIAIGAGVLPSLQPASLLDGELLSNPIYGAWWSILVDRAQLGVVVVKDALKSTASVPSSAAFPNSLNPVRSSDLQGVEITFENGRSLVSYYVSLDDVYQVVNQLPSVRSTVTQSFLVVPTQPLYGVNQTASSPVIPPQLPFSFNQNQQFVTAQVGLGLASYYVKVGKMFIALEQARDVSGAVIPYKFCAWKATGGSLRTNSAVLIPSITVSSDRSQFIITGYPYFSDAAQSEANCYFAEAPQVSDGITRGFVVAAHEKFFQGREPVFQGYFQGQVSFYLSSLRRLRSISKEEILGSPYYIYPLALYFATQRQIAQLPPDDNFIPVSFKTSENQSWHGMIVLKTGFFAKGQDASTYKDPQQYYKVVPSEQKFQLWYTPNNTIPMQVNNDFLGTTIVAMNMISLDEYNVWPAGLVDIFKSAAIKFVGQKMREKTPGFWDRIAAVFKPSAVEYEKAPA